MKRRTKIVATLGPATDTRQQLENLLDKGVDVVRINFSHGSGALHRDRVEAVRAWSRKRNKQVGILADLQGPKIRISQFRQGSVTLEKGAHFSINTKCDGGKGNVEQVGTDYPSLAAEVHSGDTLLLDDGRIVLRVLDIEKDCIATQVEVGGLLSDNKGINLRGGGLSAEALTHKDRKDILLAAGMGVDYVALSFTQSDKDILQARKLLRDAGSGAGVIAKIERAEAVVNIDAITAVSDGLMVARGDLAVEIGDAEVPAIQKLIIRKANRMNKPVITATQMMESMIDSSVPTRAEVSDVANAILDGTDAVMLSAETAVGNNPEMVVEAVHRVCLAVEKQPIMCRSHHRIDHSFDRVDEMIAMASMYAANHIKVKAIAAISASGITPLWMSRIRTGTPIYGLSNQTSALGRMTLYRNVFPLSVNLAGDSGSSVEQHAIQKLKKHGAIEPGDYVILTKGDKPGVHGGTNVMHLVTAS